MFFPTIREEITKEKMSYEANGDSVADENKEKLISVESSPFQSLGDEDSKSRESHDLEREKSRDRDMNRERDRHRRDRHRDDRSRERSEKRERERDDDHHHRRSRRRSSRDRERVERYMPRSRSRSRSERRSRSEHRHNKRVSGFDIPPPSSALLAATDVAATGQLPSVPAIPNIPGMFAMVPNQQLGALPLLPVQAMTQQATRHARRVYVGGLPPTANEQSVATFFSQVMSAVGGDLLHQLAAPLGPSQPNPNLNLAAVGFSSVSTGGLEGPDRIFVGGLPYYLTEDQIKELLESFGPLRGFNLVKDRETGNSMGYAFCVFQDPLVTDMACVALNGIQMGNRTLTVRRAVQGSIQPKPEQEDILLHAQQQIALQRLMLQPGGTPTKIVCLTQVVSADDLGDDEEYKEIMEDMREEGGNFGNLVKVVIPRPSPDPDHNPTPGVGKVFLEYADVDGAAKARLGMNGRKFGGNQVVAVYYPENKYAQGDYEGC
ncbi:unnamed protein product [Eruca vesicaria subsp. sativa]|uniref:Splicing factor U2af large subunit n=1 Tax=Eruca vesicaria subsp. sativa TaxID=29727 RepID=A0ABC8LEG8_ERUVS|nr:unnamed protein product [Eruca vesicaria subsp. sativa]